MPDDTKRFTIRLSDEDAATLRALVERYKETIPEIDWTDTRLLHAAIRLGLEGLTKRAEERQPPKG